VTVLDGGLLQRNPDPDPELRAQRNILNLCLWGWVDQKTASKV